MSAAGDWWTAAFGDAYLDVYAHRDDGAAARETAFAAAVLGAAPGARVLDAGCGAGRHARALAAAGFRVAAMDRSAALVRAGVSRGGGPAFVVGDLRAVPFRAAAFAHVVSFFTSFGYFDGAGDRAQLREFRRVLRDDGSLFLDFLNAPRVVATLVPSSERSVGARTIRETRAVRGGRVEKDVTVSRGDEALASWTESVRLWTRDEVRALLADARLRVDGEWGDLAGGPWSDTSERLVLRARAA